MLNTLKKIVCLLIDILIMSAMLTLSIYFSLNSYIKYLVQKTKERYAYDITLFDTFPIALFYTVIIIILFFITFFTFRRIINFSKFKYLICFLIAGSFINFFKLYVGVFDISDNINNIEIIIVALFGFVVAKIMSKYISLT